MKNTRSNNFAIAVEAELQRARAKHQKPINSMHEGYAVIKEELDEYWDETRKQFIDRNNDAIWCELVQVGAMAQRVAEDLLLS